MRITWASLALILMALPALADGEGTIKIEPVAGQADNARPELPEGVSSADGQKAPRPRRLRAGEVLFHLEDADLATEVLPLLEQQAGIKLGFQADSRLVTLKLVQPVHWETALDLLCEFADVHLTKTHEGKVVVRNDYGGELGSRQNWDDVAGTLDAESVQALDARRKAAAQRRAANYGKIKARQAQANARAKFNGTSAPGGFGWQGGAVRGQYSRAQYTRAQYTRAPRQQAQYSRAQYSRGVRSQAQYSRAQYSRGSNTRAVISRGQYSRGVRSQAQYSRGNPARGQYSRGSRGVGGR